VYILDTSIIIELLRRNPLFIRLFHQLSSPGVNIFTTTLVYYEIQRGIVYRNATGQKRRLNILLQTVIPLGVDAPQVLDKAAEIHSELRSNGLTFQDIDIFVMAVALLRDLTVVTTDPDFVQATGVIPNLKVDQW
jgi:predicted nucleic acid-binding protein